MKGEGRGTGPNSFHFLNCWLVPAPWPCAAIPSTTAMRRNPQRHEGPPCVLPRCWWLWAHVPAMLAIMWNLSGPAPFQLHPTRPANSIHCPPPAPTIHHLPPTIHLHPPIHPATIHPSIHYPSRKPLTNPHPPNLHPPCRMESTTHHLHLSTRLLSIHPHPLHRSTNPPIHPSRLMHTLAGWSQISPSSTTARQPGGSWRTAPRPRGALHPAIQFPT